MRGAALPAILRARMALFSSDAKEALKRLANKEFGSAEVRDEMLASIENADLRARDVIWMLFRPDRAFRDSASKILQRVRDPETVFVFINEMKAKPEAAVRAAVNALFALGLAGLENDLARALATPPKETKETREMQEMARRVVLEAPAARAIDALLWQLASVGPAEERIIFLNRLALQQIDERTVARWQKLTQDNDPAVREKALEVLATKVATPSIALFVQHLPLVSYNTQQVLIDALTRASATQPPEFADQLLPLVASGDAGTRTAVLKILLSMQNPSAVVKRYIRFTKNLAGFVRDRALESLRVFGSQLIEPAIELFGDPDDELRAAALAVASTFEDPRLVPATIALLKDEDWWIRIAAAETLGRL